MTIMHTMRPFASVTIYKDYKIGTTSANLLRLRDLGVPYPDQVIYSPYATSYVRGDGSKVGDGEATIDWIWDVIAVQEIARILNIYFSASTITFVDTIFLRSDKRTGDLASPDQNFVDFQATVHRPELFGPDGTPVTRSAFAIQTVKLRFTNLVEV